MSSLLLILSRPLLLFFFLIDYIAVKRTLCTRQNPVNRSLMLLFQDFATPSLDSVDKTIGIHVVDDDDDDDDDDDNDADDDDDDDDGSDDEMNTAVEVAQLFLRRHWETRYEELM